MTQNLIADPELSALIDTLASAKRIESEHIGEGGTPSQVYTVYTRLAKALTPQQAVALLRHPSPVVRGYFAMHVIEQLSESLPDALDAVYPLLADDTKVEDMSGCMIARVTVGYVTMMTLRGQKERPAVQAMLLRAVADPQIGALRAEALQAVALQRPSEATTLAQGLLRHADPQLVAGAIRTLGMTADGSSAQALCAMAQHAQHEIRAAVAAALGSLRHPDVEPTLRKMLEDPNDYVRLLAGSSYVRQPQRDVSVVRRLFADRSPRVRSHVAQTLATLGGSEELKFLREYLATEPRSSDVVSELRKTYSDDVAAFMREILTSKLGSDVLVRAQAVIYLRDLADDKSLPIFLKALRSSYIGERTAAAEGIAALGERGATSALIKLLDDSNPHGRLAAARALVALRASEAQKAVERAAKSDPTWAKKELLELAQKLR